MLQPIYALAVFISPFIRRLV